MPKLTISKKPFKGKPVGAEIELTDRQARLLTKLGRAQYMTRDMVAAQPLSGDFVDVLRPTPLRPHFESKMEAVQVDEPAADEAEVDSSGSVWDERIHSATKSKNTDGTWRKRPGPKSAEE